METNNKQEVPIKIYEDDIGSVFGSEKFTELLVSSNNLMIDAFNNFLNERMIEKSKFILGEIVVEIFDDFENLLMEKYPEIYLEYKEEIDYVKGVLNENKK